MPAREINLIISKQTATPEEMAVRKLIGFWTPVVLIVYLIILFSTFFVMSYFGNRLQTTNTAITTEKTRIASMIKDESLYILLKQKAISLQKILSQRYPFSEVLTYFLGYKTDGVTITKAQLSDDGNVTLEVTTQDAAILDAFVRKLIEEAPVQFHTIDLVNLAYKTDGSYTVVLDIGKKNSK